MSKVNNRNTKTRCETSSKLTIKTPERRQVFVMFLLNFEQVNSSRAVLFFDVFYTQYTIVTCRLMFKTLTTDVNDIVLKKWHYQFQYRIERR